MDRRDTKGTRELIKALNPESELRAVDKQEEEFIERAQLRRDTKRNSVFRKGIKYLKKKGSQGLRRTRNAASYVGRKTGDAASYVGQKTGNAANAFVRGTRYADMAVRKGLSTTGDYLGKKLTWKKK